MAGSLLSEEVDARMALLSEYGFNEGSGTTTADSSGNSRNLTASNTTTSWDAAGKNGSGARPEHTGVMSANTNYANFTIMFWVKRTGTWSGWQQFFGQAAGANLWVEANSSDYVIGWWNGFSALSSGVVLTLDTWFHVAVTATAGFREIWVGGVSKASHTVGTVQWNFGNVNCFASRTGSVVIVDELRIFDTALTQADIQTWMNTPVGGTFGVPGVPRPRLNYGALLQV